MQVAQEWCNAAMKDLRSKDSEVQAGARQRLHQQAATLDAQVADLAERSRWVYAAEAWSPTALRLLRWFWSSPLYAAAGFGQPGTDSRCNLS